MTLGELRDLYAYDGWANGRVFDAVMGLPDGAADASVVGSFPSIRATLAHIVGAEWVWLRRWVGENPTSIPAWSSGDDLAALRRRLHAIESERQAWFDQLTASDFTRVLAYRNLAGESHATPLADLFRHVVNHSSYHRGQVTLLLRQAGHAAPSTDLVAYVRLKGRKP